MPDAPAYFVPRTAPDGFVAAILAVSYQRPIEFVEQINHTLCALGVSAGEVVFDMLLANGSRGRRYYAMNFDGREIRFDTQNTLHPSTPELEQWSKQAFASCPFSLDTCLVDRTDPDGEKRALLPDVLPTGQVVRTAAENSERLLAASRLVPSAPRRRRPPGFGVDTSQTVSEIVEGLAARISEVQSEEGVLFAFRYVDLGVDSFNLMPEGLETIMRIFSDRGYAVAFKGSCAPGVTAIGKLTISWQC